MPLPSQKTFLSFLLQHHPPLPNTHSSPALSAQGCLKVLEPHHFQGSVACTQTLKDKMC